MERSNSTLTELQKISKYDALKLIPSKKQASIGKHKELWEPLKSLGIANKVISNFNPIDTLTKIFKNLFSKFFFNLPNPPGKYNLQSIIGYYYSFTISDDFCLNNTSEEKILKIMTNIDSSKAAGVERFSSRFLKDGTNILAKPSCALCNLSNSQRVFRNACKVAKLKSFFRKGKKADPSN